jgi:hypothetical protein
MTSTPDPERCNRCRYWLGLGEVDVNDPNFSLGVCRRDPPRIVEAIANLIIERPVYGRQSDLELDEVDMSVVSRFPGVFASDWCGRFERPGDGRVGNSLGSHAGPGRLACDEGHAND